MRPGNLICLKLRITRFGDPFEPRLGKDNESVRMWLVPIANGLFKYLPVASRKIHHQSHVLPIHYGQDFFRRRVVVSLGYLPTATGP